jgi:hypothetical protein
MRLAGTLATLGPVQAAGLLPAGDAEGVKSPTDNVIPHARQVTDSATTNQHDRVFLQVVAFARDVDRHFLLVGKPNTRDLSQGGVRLFRCHRTDLQADAALLGALLKHRRLGKLPLRMAASANKLINRGHGRA